VWSAVELREIRVVLALCEELHFGRTAARLRLTPSRVSQVIRELEAKLGGKLVERTSRSVALTPLGARLLDRVSGAHAELSQALEQTHAETRRLEGTLRLGLFSASSGGPLLKTVIELFESRHRSCHVETSEVPFDDPFGPLSRGEIPLMATWLPHGQADVVVGPMLNREPRVVLIASDHPLANRRTVSAEALADYRVPRFERMPQEFRETWIPTRTPRGKAIPSVRMDMVHRDLHQLGMRIARGELVHVTIPSAVPLFSAGLELVAIRVTDLPPWRSALVWRRRSLDLKAREFVRAAQDVVKSRSA
jgi:DNA-binding transcriptional LysR family regulator